jgi:opacity protein-like surface antigen
LSGSRPRGHLEPLGTALCRGGRRPRRPDCHPTCPTDFLFARPRGSVAVRGGWLFERAGSDLFAFVQDQLTVEKKDFDAPAIAVDAGVALTPRADVLFGFEFGGVTTKSEYRDYVDNNRLPITQATRLRQVNLSTSLRMALTPRGQEVSRLAWIPNAVTPYVGAGAGALWYEFHQTGDFVDFVDFSVFEETFRSSGWTPSAHLFGGVDVKVSRRLFVTGEGRYLWSHAELDRDFSGFEPIDLTGFKLTAGVSYIF